MNMIDILVVGKNGAFLRPILKALLKTGRELDAVILGELSLEDAVRVISERDSRVVLIPDEVITPKITGERLASELRRAGFDGRIVAITRRPCPWAEQRVLNNPRLMEALVEDWFRGVAAAA